jgi:hypothetical protein
MRLGMKAQLAAFFTKLDKAKKGLQ